LSEKKLCALEGGERKKGKERKGYKQPTNQTNQRQKILLFKKKKKKVEREREKERN